MNRNNPFRPSLWRTALTAVTADDLRRLGAKAVALDADNTSSLHGTTDPIPGTREWIRGMQEAGFPVILVSNAAAERAEKLAGNYGIPAVPLAGKPSPKGCRNAAERLGIAPSELVMIGDQIQTDILGAGLAGCPSIYVEPYARERRMPVYFFVKRTLDKLLIRLMNLDRPHTN